VYMIAYSAGHATTLPDATPSGNVDNVGGTSLTGLSITTATNDAEVILHGSYWSDTVTATPPAGMTERVEFSTLYCASGSQAVAGASGNKVATMSATDFWTAIMVASKPAVPGGAAAASRLLVPRRWRFMRVK
jgi:hypothetical protein